MLHREPDGWRLLQEKSVSGELSVTETHVKAEICHILYEKLVISVHLNAETWPTWAFSPYSAVSG